MLQTSQDPSCPGCSFRITKGLTYVKSLLKSSLRDINPGYLIYNCNWPSTHRFPISLYFSQWQLLPPYVLHSSLIYYVHFQSAQLKLNLYKGRDYFFFCFVYCHIHSTVNRYLAHRHSNVSQILQ